ncbi:CdiI family contact-dependent growth inhibition immunity protein [Leeia sp. TBRC 13508]|uniref:CdiI family contact-dependent growth inhibition immunity protein n=1 Tax=Leeia speluncae TaxID=2884804 RepID=A0ABS8D6B4_9NEIS|nr:contact-dependent growth inhibition system immunity protein [Leeia speluncae]MCB6183168.1 CdiI family contact-dependent growth inhibition immunity protein [Leeia speluncae]
MNEVTRGYWAGVVCNADFICMDTFSGYRGGSNRDPKGKQYIFPPDASDLALGEALKDTLAHSRWVLPAPREGLTFPAGVEFDVSLGDYKVNYPVWVSTLMELHGYKTKRALFKGMKNVGIESKNNVITFTPTHHA